MILKNRSRSNRIGVKLSAAVIYSSKIMFMLVKVKVKVKVNLKRQDFSKICSLTLNPEVQLRAEVLRIPL
jgi:hypothetical protein